MPFSCDVLEEFSSVEVLKDMGFPGGGSGVLSVCGSAGLPGVFGVFEVPDSLCWKMIWTLTPFLFLIMNLLCRSPFLTPESVEPYVKSRRYKYGEFVPRRAAVVKEEDPRRGLWSRLKVGSELSIVCKMDAELLGPQ